VRSGCQIGQVSLPVSGLNDAALAARAAGAPAWPPPARRQDLGSCGEGSRRTVSPARRRA